MDSFFPPCLIPLCLALRFIMMKTKSCVFRLGVCMVWQLSFFPILLPWDFSSR